MPAIANLKKKKRDLRCCLGGWRSSWFGCCLTYETGHVNGLVTALQYLPVCQQLGYVVKASNLDNIYLRSWASSSLKGRGPASVGTESRSDSYYRAYTGWSRVTFLSILLSVCHEEMLLWRGFLLQFMLLLELKPTWFLAISGFIAMPDWFQAPLLGKFLITRTYNHIKF